MSSPIKNVVVVGATGIIGPAVIHALEASNSFNITILRHTPSPPSPTDTTTAPQSGPPPLPPGAPPKTSSSTLPATIPIKQIPLTDPTSLAAALTNQHALISCVGYPGLSTQRALIDACMRSPTVSRFMPSEFGDDTLHRKEGSLPELEIFTRAKTETLEYLRTVCGGAGGGDSGPDQTGKLVWTGLATGPFLDWALGIGALGLDMRTKKATLYDGGDEPFSGTVLSAIGQAVVACLLAPEGKVGNRLLCIRSIATSQRELLGEMVRQLSGGDEGAWDVSELDTAECYRRGQEAIKAGDRRGAMAGILSRQTFQAGGGRGLVADPADGKGWGNGILDVQEVGVEEIVRTARAYMGMSRG